VIAKTKKEKKKKETKKKKMMKKKLIEDLTSLPPEIAVESWILIKCRAFNVTF